MTTIIGGKLMEIDKSAFQNVIKHTDTHNRLKEMDEMWKQHEKKTEIEIEDTRNKKCRKITEKLYTGKLHSDHMKDKTSGFWTKKLMEFEEKDPDRWGHSGFKELYPEDFGAVNQTQGDVSKKENESEAKLAAEHAASNDKNASTQRQERNRPERSLDVSRFRREGRRRQFEPLRNPRRDQGFSRQQNRFRSRSRDRNRPPYQKENGEQRRRLPGRFDRRNARDKLQQSDDSMSGSDNDKGNKKIKSEVGKVNQVKCEKERQADEKHSTRRKDSPHQRAKGSHSNERERPQRLDAERSSDRRRSDSYREKRSRDRSYEKSLDDDQREMSSFKDTQRKHTKESLTKRVDNENVDDMDENKVKSSEGSKQSNEHPVAENVVTLDAFGRDVSKRRNYRRNRSSSFTREDYSATKGWKYGEKKANTDVYTSKEMVDEQLETNNEALLSNPDKGASIVSIDYEKLDYEEEEVKITLEDDAKKKKIIELANESLQDAMQNENRTELGEKKRLKKEKKSKKKHEKKKKKRRKTKENSPEASKDDAAIDEDKTAMKDGLQLKHMDEYKYVEGKQSAENEDVITGRDHSSLLGLDKKDVPIAESKLQDFGNEIDEAIDHRINIEAEIRDRIKKKMKEKEILELQRELLESIHRSDDDVDLDDYRGDQPPKRDVAKERKSQDNNNKDQLTATRHRRKSSNDVHASDQDRKEEDSKHDKKREYRPKRYSRSSSKERKSYRKKRDIEETEKGFTRARRGTSSSTDKTDSSSERSKTRKIYSEKKRETSKKDLAIKKKDEIKQQRRISAPLDSVSSYQDVNSRHDMKRRNREDKKGVSDRRGPKEKVNKKMERQVAGDSDLSSESPVDEDQLKKKKMQNAAKHEGGSSREKNARIRKGYDGLVNKSDSESSVEGEQKRSNRARGHIRRKESKEKDSDTDDSFSDTVQPAEKKHSRSNHVEKHKFTRASEERAKNRMRDKDMHSPRRTEVKRRRRKLSRSETEDSDEKRSMHLKARQSRAEKKKQDWRDDGQAIKNRETKQGSRRSRESSDSHTSDNETDSRTSDSLSDSKRKYNRTQQLKSRGTNHDEERRRSISKHRYQDGVSEEQRIRKSREFQKHSREQGREIEKTKADLASRKSPSRSSSEFSLYEDIDLKQIKVQHKDTALKSQKLISRSQEKNTKRDLGIRSQSSERDSSEDFGASHRKNSKMKSGKGRASADRTDSHRRRRSRSETREAPERGRRSPAHHRYKRRHNISDSESEERRTKIRDDRKRRRRKYSSSSLESERSLQKKNKKADKKSQRKYSTQSDSSWSSESDQRYQKKRKNKKHY